MKKVLLVIASAFILTAHAYNTSFLEYSPIFYFTKQDMSMMQAAINKALNQTKDKNKVNWKNASTGAYGYTMPSNTTRTQDMTCRYLTIFNSARGITNEATYKYCNIKGQWKIVE